MLVYMDGYAQGPGNPGDGGPNTPPYPIDENLILLGSVALLLGLYTIYKNKNIKKASS